MPVQRSTILTHSTSLGCNSIIDITLSTRLRSVDTLGNERVTFENEVEIPFEPWMQAELDPLQIPMPNDPGLAILELRLQDAAGHVHHRNFVSFVVQGDASS